MRIGGQMPRGNSWGVKFSLRNCCVGSCYGNSANRRPAPATGWRMRICFCTYQTCAVTGWTTGMSRSSSTGTHRRRARRRSQADGFQSFNRFPSTWRRHTQGRPFDFASRRSVRHGDRSVPNVPVVPQQRSVYHGDRSVQDVPIVQNVQVVTEQRRFKIQGKTNSVGRLHVLRGLKCLKSKGRSRRQRPRALLLKQSRVVMAKWLLVPSVVFKSGS